MSSGCGVNECVAVMRQLGLARFAYDPSSSEDVDMMLDAPDQGVCLHFDATTQRLKCIQVTDFTRTNMDYQHQPLARYPSLDA
jgi:hypothetical protein